MSNKRTRVEPEPVTTHAAAPDAIRLDVPISSSYLSYKHFKGSKNVMESIDRLLVQLNTLKTRHIMKNVGTQTDPVETPLQRPRKRQRVQKKTPQEEFLCMICFERPPNTVVNPCKCCVVCEQCSLQLSYSNNEHVRTRCVRCLQEIQSVSYPGREMAVLSNDDSD